MLAFFECPTGNPPPHGNLRYVQVETGLMQSAEMFSDRPVHIFFLENCLEQSFNLFFNLKKYPEKGGRELSIAHKIMVKTCQEGARTTPSSLWERVTSHTRYFGLKYFISLIFTSSKMEIVIFTIRRISLKKKYSIFQISFSNTAEIMVKCHFLYYKRPTKVYYTYML